MQNKVYRQIAESIENDILSGFLRDGMLLPSTQVLVKKFNVNANTVAHAVSLLAKRGLTVTRRGIGVEILENARERVYEARQNSITENYVEPLIAECKQLGLSKQELIAVIIRDW
jgi:DNA-binding transcriptional regulator YhcF (GntR family)